MVEGLQKPVLRAVQHKLMVAQHLCGAASVRRDLCWCRSGCHRGRTRWIGHSGYRRRGRRLCVAVNPVHFTVAAVMGESAVVCAEVRRPLASCANNIIEKKSTRICLHPARHCSASVNVPGVRRGRSRRCGGAVMWTVSTENNSVRLLYVIHNTEHYESCTKLVNGPGRKVKSR